jgi:hypothetical protein
MSTFNKEELEILLATARAEYRHLGQVRDDLHRNKIINIDVDDDIFDHQSKLYLIIEKLQKLTGEIPS